MTWELEDGTALQTEAGTDFQLESDGVLPTPTPWTSEAAGPRTIRQLYHWVWNNFSGVTSYFGSLNTYLQSVFNSLINDIQERNRWMGIWEDGTYEAFDQVTDNSWLMIANKTTTDRAAPTPTGNPIQIYPPPDPTWTVNNYVGHVYSVLETTVPTEGLYALYDMRIWVQGITADDYYQVLVQDGVSGAFEEVISFTGDILTESGWFEVPYPAGFLRPGSVGRVWLHQWNTGSSNDQTFPWVRAANTNGNGDPGTGNWSTRNNGANVRINDLDDNGVDRSAIITDNALIGSVLRMQQANDANKWLEFTINSITDEAGWVVYGTSEIGDGPTGEPDVGAICDITFQVPVLATTDYVTLAGHLTTWPALQSYIAFDDPLTAVPSQDGVGIDLIFQEYYLSPDWDPQAYSGGSQGGVASISQVREIQLLDASSFNDQYPTGLGIPLQVEFGGAQSIDEFDVSAAGAFTCKIPDQYVLSLRLVVGRTNAGGELQLYMRMLVDGIQVGNSLHTIVDNQRIEMPLTLYGVFDIDVGQVITFEIIRDTDGANNGGLQAGIPDVPGWASAPSARLTIARSIVE